jgi:hypothetical protein
LKSISKIYLAWRKGKGFSRHVVGVLKRNTIDGVTFKYLKENIDRAKQDGFSPYTDFPDLDRTYSKNVLEIFSQRLVSSERSDIQKYYEFWELDPAFVHDKFYLLAYTQGMLSTDNFEFLAHFYPKADLRFVSEICGLSERKMPRGTVQIGEELSWKKEPDNKFDPYAIQVFKSEILIGYIKKIHNLVFDNKSKQKLRIIVKEVDQNGSTNRIFVVISFK